MKKNWLVVLLCCLLALGIASTVNAWSLKEAAAPYKGATVRVSAMSGYQFNANAVKLAQEFTKETGIKVEIDQVTYAEVIEKHMMELTSGNPAHDLYDVDSIYCAQYAPHCVPIEQYMKNPKLMDPGMKMDDFYSQLLEGLSYDRKLYAFPQMWCFASMFIRKDLAKKAGVKFPPCEGAWTLEQYYRAAKKLTMNVEGKRVYGATLSGARTGIGDEVYTLFWGAGGSLFDDTMKPTFGKGGKYYKEMVKTLTYYQKIYTEKLAPPGSTDYEIGEAAGAFNEGLTALSWNWNLCASWQDVPGAKQYGKIAVSLIPRDNPNAKRWHRQGTKGYYISKDSKNKEAAYLFIQWLSNPAMMAKTVFEMKDSTPPRKSILNDPKHKDMFSHWCQLRYVGENKMDRPVPYIPEWSQCEDIMAVPFQQNMVGKIKPEDAADTAAKGLEDLLKSKGYYEEGKPFRAADGKYPVWLTGNYPM